MDSVATYRFAYHDSSVNLCARHVHESPHPLGPVTHAPHAGLCDMCADELARKDAAELAEALAAERRMEEL